MVRSFEKERSFDPNNMSDYYEEDALNCILMVLLYGGPYVHPLGVFRYDSFNDISS